MLDYVQARQIWLKTVKPAPIRWLSLEQGLHKRLAQDITAPFDLPRFDNSAVDGYALCLNEQNPIFTLQGQAQAGQDNTLTLLPGQAQRIFTGAPIPQGANAIVMQENTKRTHNQLTVLKLPTLGQNIRVQGEEFSQGTVVLPAGHPINPASIGLLATLGLCSIPVAQAPKITLLITGNELIQPGTELLNGQIYDANGPALAAALRSMGAQVQVLGPIPDTERDMHHALEQLPESDLILSTGGVSVGDFDWTRKCVLDQGWTELFWKVAIKPGKPLFAAQLDQKLFLGLPGNPVAALVLTQLFIRPWLQIWFHSQPQELIHLALKKPAQHALGRDEWARARIHLNANPLPLVELLAGKGSHMLGSMAQCNALALLAGDQSHFQEGHRVPVLPVEWF